MTYNNINNIYEPKRLKSINQQKNTKNFIFFSYIIQQIIHINLFYTVTMV